MQSIFGSHNFIKRRKIMITGIYMFINKSNNKKYVGQSIDCHRRYTEHKRTGDLERYSAKNERDSNTPIHRAF